MLHGAGSTCVDFSAASKKKARMTGPHVLPFMIWCKTRVSLKEPVLFHECVAGHPSELLLKRYVGVPGKYHVFTCLLCPSELGYPCTRKRRYSIAIADRMLRPDPPALLLPAETFGAAVWSNGELYFSANDEEIRAYVDRLQLERLHRKGDPMLVDPESETVFTDLLSAGDRKRLAGYMDMVEAGSFPPPYLANLSQNASWAGRPSRMVGCLTKNTKYWSLGLGRPMLPSEALKVMGMKAQHMPRDPSTTFSENELRAFAGNGLHIPSVGAVLMYTIAFLLRDPQQQQQG